MTSQLHGAEAVRDAITRTIVTLPEELRRSLTWDQGAEMAQHARLKIDAGVQVYFCDPQSPWQRGTNENTNGLLRQYFPKGTDLSAHSAEEIAAVAAALNARPRKTLGWKTPAEHLTSGCRRSTKSVLRRPFESVQYTAIEFGKRCREAGVRPSMGSVGDAYDNAMAQSFFATLECELLDRRTFKTQAEARMAVFEFIEGFTIRGGGIRRSAISRRSTTNAVTPTQPIPVDVTLIASRVAPADEGGLSRLCAARDTSLVVSYRRREA